jgi:hypothetical protein
MLENLRIPAAMDGLMIAELGTPARPSILGRADVATTIGAATWVPQHSSYCVIASDVHNDSMHLLAEYLRAYPA